jgi:hypothetical protein
MTRALFVNGTRVFDGKDYERLEQGPGQVLDRFLPARAAQYNPAPAPAYAAAQSAQPVSADA